MFKDKILLITGGTGSFGKTVLNRFIDSNLSKIIIFSRDEKKQEELRLKYNSDKLKFVIGDVRDYKSIHTALRNVDFVFHAAALKQVPSCEFYPMEAVNTNIIGTDNVLTAAISQGVKKVVVLSTDKAVYPINAMGISKAMAEKIVFSKSKNFDNIETIMCCTRYGNVMASRGSVIPLFLEQAITGKNITITDPAMTRFLMSLEDSVDLVLHAFKNAQQGDLFVQKAPASTVGDLAQAIIQLTNSNSKIKIVGSRHGEKLYESLISREEKLRAIEEGSYYRVPSDNRSLNYSLYENKGQLQLNDIEDYTSHNTQQLNVSEVIKLVSKLPEVKEYLKGHIVW
ncbi:polysaccharide biosynthesis protein [Proteus mirabilis]|nr:MULTISPECIES: polysaccharide biosynthesis protein [Morganellaceae]EMA4724132.1 polysaccharide biosynthesis protein [Proteus mirabilis]MCL8621429.1 polysaccharide biosynthesis protein [Proteus mirabilis]MCL8632632.1 polysaccharide biosynthesis protein [Proteus mirabilis]MCR4081617.1 polysaccharide biosynthesis protein [Providencia stuartii]MDX7494644.1 polysaccharide biosynthesis protein [Providencia stuartii]